jgi:hypothetical protein
LAFSPSNIGLLVGTAGNVHYVIDSQRGYTMHRLRGHEGLEKASLPEGTELGMVAEAGISGQECGWTPDGRYVYSGESRIVKRNVSPLLTLDTLQDRPTISSASGIFPTTLPISTQMRPIRLSVPCCPPLSSLVIQLALQEWSALILVLPVSLPPHTIQLQHTEILTTCSLYVTVFATASSQVALWLPDRDEIV